MLIHKIRKCLILLVTATAFVATPGAFAQITQYEVIDLGELHPGNTLHVSAGGISDSGLVTGSSISSTTREPEAFLWDNGVMTGLGFLPFSESKPSSGGNAVNDSGQVVGLGRIDLVSGRSTPQGFLWETGTMTELFPSLRRSSGRDINNVGQIVGTTTTNVGFARVKEAFILQGGTVTRIANLPTPSVATAINDFGHVVGSAPNSFGILEAFLWDGTSLQALGFLSGAVPPRSGTNDINNSDQVVGTSFRADGSVEAVLWDAGTIIPLGFLNPADPRPGSGSFANAINDSGQIVGTSGSAPFLYHEGTMVNLNSLLQPGTGWRLNRANDINNAGEIVGDGDFLQQGGRAFLLRPLPNEVPICGPVAGPILFTIGQDGEISAQLEIAAPFTLTLTGDDPGDTLGVSHSALPDGATLSFTDGPAPVDAVFQWTPGCLQVGIHQFEITFTDSHGEQAICSLTLEVVNPPPTCVLDVDTELFPLDPGGVINPDIIRGVTVTIGQTFVATITADDECDTLTLNASGVPAGATLTPGPGTSGAPFQTVLEWTPTDADVVGNPHFVLIEFTDFHGAPATCILEITVNRPPTAVCNATADQVNSVMGNMITVECDDFNGALVTLDGTASSDPDGDTLTYRWSVSDLDVNLNDATSPTPSGIFPPGSVVMATLTVADGRGGIDTCDVILRVVDTTPPQSMCTTTVARLWPPRHGMHDVTIFITATDDCTDPNFVFPIHVQVRSDEPDNTEGVGDGNTTGDVHGQDGFATPVVLATPDDFGIFTWNASALRWEGTIQLRAERDGTGDGRSYIIEATAFDASLNATIMSCVVVVPHDQRGK